VSERVLNKIMSHERLWPTVKIKVISEVNLSPSKIIGNLKTCSIYEMAKVEGKGKSNFQPVRPIE
jgi:hypothetical protein